jgi:pimeloyl-ACP methyl ester carboxylesterase
VVSVAHGTTGIVPGCAPSLLDDPFAGGNEHTMATMVDDGWVGVMTDYEGLGTAGPHPYLVGTAEAYSVLDAVRAARSLDDLALSGKTVVWGHSQGGGAALWTGIVAREYAPDVDVLGVAAVAPAADLRSLAEGVKDTAAGRVVSAYLAQAWSDVYDLDLSTIVTPGYLPVVRRVADRCFWGRDAIANVLLGTQLSSPVIQPSALDGETGRLLDENSPHGLSEPPVLVAQGDADRLVLPGPQDDFVAQWCATGQPVDYRTYPGLDHVPIVEADSPLVPELVAWTQDRLAGRPPTPTCGAG